MVWLAYGFGALWIFGFAMCVGEIDLGKTVWSKIKRIVMLFFIWPIIVIAIINQGDV